jgi:adenine-specific DNA-methyltransferase
VKPYYSDSLVTIYHGDCRDVLPSIDSAALVIMDPPYHGVVDETWDSQWANDGDFLKWLDVPVALATRTLADNGTLYVFCWATLAARIETAVVSRYARPIASCVWDKGETRKGVGGTGIDVTSLRTYWAANSERCIVAEKIPERFLAADDAAREESGYWSACEAGKRSVFGDYLVAEFARAGVTRKQIAALFPSKTGGLTGCVSNWVLGYNIPTAEQYEAMRSYLNARGDEYLRQNYEYLRQNYEDLRQNYEDLRRPFFLTAAHQWGDVWRCALPSKRQHPTEKPLALMSQIVEVSSRAGDLVVDPFAGSGSGLRAAKDMGRRAIGIEIDERYCEIAAERCRQEVLDFGAIA